ncbi:peptidase [Dipodfec virus UOA04_Rod_495]|nr:peptidase [Dipodfec virus UOA04_Rod_495]
MALSNKDLLVIKKCIVTIEKYFERNQFATEVLNSLYTLMDGKSDYQFSGSHFKLSEFLASPTAVKHGITLSPSPDVFNSLFNLVCNVLEPARERLGKPIYITSGYRSQQLNRLVGGVSNSMHLYGRAADVWCDDLDKLHLILKDLPHTELIVHKSYIHVAL